MATTPAASATRLGSAVLGVGTVLLAISLGSTWVDRHGLLGDTFGRVAFATGSASVLCGALVFLANLGGSRVTLTRVFGRIGLASAAIMALTGAAFVAGETTSSGFVIFVVGWAFVVVGLIDHWQ